MTGRLRGAGRGLPRSGRQLPRFARRLPQSKLASPATAVALALVLQGSAGCALAPVHCASGTQRMLDDRLFFGTAERSGSVTPAEWDRFLNDVVTARFPQGLTTWAAAGQWRGENGIPVREATHVVDILHPADAASRRAIGEIAAIYRSRFEQEAVLRVTTPVCAAFE